MLIPIQQTIKLEIADLIFKLIQRKLTFSQVLHVRIFGSHFSRDIQHFSGGSWLSPFPSFSLHSGVKEAPELLLISEQRVSVKGCQDE